MIPAKAGFFMPATREGSQKGGGMCAGFVLTPATSGNTLVSKNNPHASGGIRPVLRTRGLVFFGAPRLDLVPLQQLGQLLQVIIVFLQQHRISCQAWQIVRPELSRKRASEHPVEEQRP